jgi:hypothetical protein
MRLSNQCWAFGCERTGSHDRLCGSICPADVIETEIIAPHHWEPRVSSDGVRVQVAQLRKSFLQRRPA